MNIRRWLLGLVVPVFGLSCTAAPPAQVAPDAGLAAQWDQTRSLLLLIADEQTYEPITVRIALQGPADLRVDLATALGRAGEARGVDTLVGLALDDDVTVRRAAVFALGELAEGVTVARPRASEALLAALVDGDREVGRLAVDALGKIATPVLEVGGLLLALEPGERWARLLPALYRFRGPEAVVLARGGLTQESPELRRWAAYALARTPQPEALPELRALLGDPDPELRAWAARAVGLVGEREDLARLRPLLDDPAATVIYPALRAGRLLAKDEPGPAEWSERLAELVADPRPGVRQVALENAAPWLAAEPLRVHLAGRATTGPPAERGAALVALATAHAPGAAGAIAAASSAAEPLVRARAAEAAAALGDSALLEAFASDPHPLVRSAVWAGRLTPLGAGEGAEITRAGLADPDPLVRATVLDWLAEHPVAPVEELEAAVQRALAGRALEECLAALGAVTARAKTATLERGALIAALEQLAQKAEHEVRRRAAAALVEMGRPEAPLGPVGAGRGAEAYERVLARAREPHTVAIVTSRGTLRARLTCAAAPLTCTNFLHLAEQGFFDGLTFHRVVPGFVIQGGDPRGDGSGGPGYSIRDEINPLPYGRGALGMALAGPHTGGSQFFISLSSQPHLAGGFTRFGELVAGDEILDTMAAGDVIVSIREVR